MPPSAHLSTLSKSLQRTHPSTSSGQALAQGPTSAHWNPVGPRTTHRHGRPETHGAGRYPVVQSLPPRVQPGSLVRSQRQSLSAVRAGADLRRRWRQPHVRHRRNPGAALGPTHQQARSLPRPPGFEPQAFRQHQWSALDRCDPGCHAAMDDALLGVAHPRIKSGAGCSRKAVPTWALRPSVLRLRSGVVGLGN